MSGIRIDKVKTEVALREHSYDSSASEYIGLVKEEDSYVNGVNGVTYQLIPVTTSEDSVSNMQDSPTHDTYYLSIGGANPVEVYAKSPSPKKVLKRESVTQQQNKAVSTRKRDDKRRATHNEVERRRRDKINTWIMKLADLVPHARLPDSASKGGILAKACDHITELNEKQKRLEKLEVENEKLVLEVLRLNQEMSELRKENTSVRNQLADNCIVFTNRQKEDKS